MKILIQILIGIGLSITAQAKITNEQLASLCHHGAPDGLAAAWLTTESTRILDSIVSKSGTPVVLNECTRVTSEANDEILNQGDECTFAYEWEGTDMTLHLPKIIKAKSLTFADGEVFIFERGFQPDFMASISITAICKRDDGTGGYFGLMNDDGLIELNP